MDAVLEILRTEATGSSQPLRGILHCFSGTADQARQGEALGLMISFGGNVTFKKAGDLRAVLAEVSDEHLLIETDAPFLAPQARRGRRNEPALVAEVAKQAASVRGAPLEDIQRLTTRNACRLFGLTSLLNDDFAR